MNLEHYFKWVTFVKYVQFDPSWSPTQFLMVFENVTNSRFQAGLSIAHYLLEKPLKVCFWTEATDLQTCSPSPNSSSHSSIEPPVHGWNQWAGYLPPWRSYQWWRALTSPVNKIKKKQSEFPFLVQGTDHQYHQAGLSISPLDWNQEKVSADSTFIK